MVLSINVIPETVEQLHERCRAQGLPISHVHHPVYKPSLKDKVNSIIVSYAKMERPTVKFCMGHLLVVKILASGDQEARLLQSVALREELFNLHRELPSSR